MKTHGSVDVCNLLFLALDVNAMFKLRLTRKHMVELWVFSLLHVCRLTIFTQSISHTEEKCFWASAVANMVVYDLTQFEAKQVSCEMAFG